jgi:hypothetical protein
MKKNQVVPFFCMCIAFIIAATAALYFQGVFDDIGMGGISILIVAYILIITLMYRFVKNNPDKF